MAPDLLMRNVLLSNTMNELCNITNILNITQFITPIIVLTFLVPVGGLSAPLPRASLLVEGLVQSSSNHFYKDSMKKVKSLCYESKYSDQCRNKSIGWWCLWVR
jgi:hypothetical protein